MLIKPINLTNMKKNILFIIFICCICLIIYYIVSISNKNKPFINNLVNEMSNLEEHNIEEYIEKAESNKKTYIKWIDFKGTASVMYKLIKLDITSHTDNEEIKINWIELMSYLSCKCGGDFSKFKQSDLDDLLKKLKNGKSISDLTNNYKLYSYYFESLDAIFHEYVGEYTIQTTDEQGNKNYITKYGIKVFSPIAKGYNFSHYKDFGTARSYGYKRVHLGNDLLGSIGTPIIAVESRIY